MNPTEMLKPGKLYKLNYGSERIVMVIECKLLRRWNGNNVPGFDTIGVRYLVGKQLIASEHYACYLERDFRELL